ncbi:MAG: hypothetical protein IJ971_12145 [Bacteroidales bacterium]|nr:hypothetical protein [Bacteroidales bacterium]
MVKEISRTLVVGLGGTGQSVIRDIKKRLFVRYGEIPSLVRFLSFDTDDDGYQDTPYNYYFKGEKKSTRRYNITKEEFKKISRPAIDVLKADQNCQRLNFDQLGRIYGLANGIGANGFRVMGRAHVLYNANSIMHTLVTTISSLRNANLAGDELANGYQLCGNGITVYIIASLAGGTGSSSFLDFSRMLQHAGIDVVPRGAGVPTDTILGMFFMPSFFVTKPNTPNVRINTYVALSELDYLLGLNNEEKYPEGCSEKEADRTEYGNYNDYKSVRFSNVYLIDEKTKKGNTHSFEEASGYVASFIAASIAADNQVLNSSYSNSTHSLHDLDGKRQIYSGLGYCEIRFKRHELVQYLLNKHLREVLNDYKTGHLDVDAIADKFISDNMLNEGVMSQEEGMEDTRAQLNELTDSIYKLDDKRFTTIIMGRVETGQAAADQIETNKKTFVTKLSAEANEAVKAFVLKKKELLKNIQALMDKHQSEKGFGCLPDLSKRFKSAFEAMRAGLEDEIAKHEADEIKIENKLRNLKASIAANANGGFLGIFGNQLDTQGELIKAYMREVDNVGSEGTPTLMRIKLEIARKKEAIEIYGALVKKVEEYYKEEEIELGGNARVVQITGSAKDVQAMYDSLRDTVQKEFAQYSSSKAAKTEIIFVDPYFKEYFDSHKNEAFELTAQAKYNLDEYLKDIFQKKPQVNEELIADMRKFILSQLPETALVKEIYNEKLSLDQIFVRCFGKASDVEDDRDLARYPHLGLFRQVDQIFDSLWQYNDFRGGNSRQVEPQCVVGVCDREDHLLNHTNGYKAHLPGNHNYQYINVGDPDRIIFILQETSIPGFTMSDANVWRNEYNQMKNSTYSFTDKNLEDIDLLFPEATNELGDIAWAYGWMFGLIASVDRRIQVKVTQDYLAKHQQVAGNSGYYDYFAIRKQRPSDLTVCKRQFVRDEALFGDIYNQVSDLMEADKAGTIVKIAHWVNDELMWANRGKQKNSMDAGERLVVQNEPLALEKRFVRLNSTMTTVTFNKTLGKIEYSDSLGILQDAEEKYQASLSKGE